MVDLFGLVAMGIATFTACGLQAELDQQAAAYECDENANYGIRGHGQSHIFLLTRSH